MNKIALKKAFFDTLKMLGIIVIGTITVAVSYFILAGLFVLANTLGSFWGGVLIGSSIVISVLCFVFFGSYNYYAKNLDK